MTSATDEFLDGLDNTPDPFKEDSDPFKAKEEPVEEKKEETIPFNKDPKIQKFIEKEVSKKLADFKPTIIEKEPISSEADKLTEVLTRIIGNDTPERQRAVKDLREELSGLTEQGANMALAQLREQAQEEQQAVEQAQDELAQGFEAVEETFNVDLSSNSSSARKMRNEFVDFIVRIAPKDRNGEVTEYPDFEETFKIFKDTQKPESTNRAKELASRSMTRSGDASTPRPSGDQSWNAVDRLFEK